MSQFKISVITVCFNVKNDIEHTIKSVINQSIPAEYIIIDGGSTDGTIDIIKRYSDVINYWSSEPDKGIFDAMNKGVSNATGEWVIFMNAGDTFYSNNVLKRFCEYDVNTYDYVVGIAKYPNGRYWVPVGEKFSLKDVFYGGAVNHQSSFIRRHLLVADPYNIDLSIVADDCYFIKKIVFEGKKYRSIPEIIANYDNTGISNSAKVLSIIRNQYDSFWKSVLMPKVICDYEKYRKKYCRGRLFRIIKKIFLYFKIKITIDK